jgi:FlgD Ig-like domain
MRTTATRIGATLVVLVSILTSPCLAVVPAHFWSIQGHGDDSGAVNSIAIMTNGDVVATGYFFGNMNLGTGTLTAASQGAGDGWIARFSRAGQVKWAKRFGTTGGDGGTCVVADATGNIYLLADIDGQVNFGGGNIGGLGSDDIALVKFDGNGNHVWSHAYGSIDFDQGTMLRIDPSGNLIMCGMFSKTINFGGTDLVPVGTQDGFIVKFNSNADFQWQQVVGGNGGQIAYGIATDPSGNIYSIGYFNTEVSFQGFAPVASAGGLDFYIAKFNSSGTPQWTQRRGGTGNDAGYGIAVDASGNVTVSGAFEGTINIGGGALVSAGGFDGYLARYNTSGVHQWSLRFGTAGEFEAGLQVAVNSSGKVFLAAFSEADLNGAPGYGGPDVLIAKYQSNGSLTWSRLIGGAGDDRAGAVGLDTGDNIVVGGFFEGGVDFGGGMRVAIGQNDLYLARYGVAEPGITSILDVGNDQGRQVRITLARSPLDDGSAALPVTQYEAWRRILPLPAALLARNGGPQTLPSGTWEYVASIPASNLTSYRMIAPTLADSTVNYGMYRTKFFVRAATANPSIFYDSPVDSGYSRDNLAPGIPSSFAYIAGNLSWNKSGAVDFDYFSVYGSNSNSFGAATLIDYTVTPALDVTASNYTYYWVTATDFSGNEGKPAKANKTTGVGGTSLPHVLSVSAYPNPFNPETTVRYTLPAREHVRIDIYDLRGERVATLVDRDQDAGAFTVTWRGRDDRGASVGSGVYFAKLATASGERTYKLTLLK